MTKNAHEELWELTVALRSHLQWQGECGATGVPPHSTESMEARRQEYRKFPYSAADWDSLELRPTAPTTPTPASKPPAAQERVTADPVSSHRTEVATPAEAAPSPQESTATTQPTSLTPLAHDLVAQTAASPSVSSKSTRVLQRDDRSLPSHPTAPPAQVAPAQPRPKGVPMDAESKEKLRLLQIQVENCSDCELSQARQNTVFSRGNGLSGLCVVGEGPGADEDAQGLPFVGKAGQLLDKMVAAMGLDREEVYVCNIVKCRPPRNRKPDLREMRACRGYLQQQIQLLAPRVIVALGATAVTGLLDLNIGITRLRGQWRLYQGKIPVMPTFHPAYLLRQPSAKRQVWEDLQEVMRVLQEQQ